MQEVITGVPVKVLSNGTEIPCIGMGTFGSDRFDS